MACRPLTITASRLPLLAGLVAAPMLLGGCYLESGGLWSADQHTYVSQEYRPQTVALVDTRTQAVIWTVDVPVGKQVVIKFRKELGEEDGAMPDLMQWQVMEAHTRTGGLENQIPVPPSYARRLDVYLRPTPELPEEVIATVEAPGSGALIVDDSGSEVIRWEDQQEQPRPPRREPAIDIDPEG